MLGRLQEIANDIQEYVDEKGAEVEREIKQAGEHVKAAIAELESLLAAQLEDQENTDGAVDPVDGETSSVEEVLGKAATPSTPYVGGDTEELKDPFAVDNDVAAGQPSATEPTIESGEEQVTDQTAAQTLTPGTDDPAKVVDLAALELAALAETVGEAPIVDDPQGVDPEYPTAGQTPSVTSENQEGPQQ